ncbi:glycosyltransferase family 4 protein [Pseudooceanicola sp. CBS1P-1]|uniref:Glycosyltransferase n=1 Tax=Pseudooceanicola albus TaxID=2692189 RepID=A0A6L7G0R2_9RHOB|nr:MULTISPECIES: glycosyltransferase family 4 protein [Pseudooceanicola]MBT9382547.1 glycosyltransferase family 4 protein [Pseudooceanicola endophyticus]MXN17088.1 glycosyltransferase [Pseudooceanicola albus]
MTDPKTLDVIAPNFKKRMSGVTSTVYRLVPLQARDIAIAACGPAVPEGVPQIPTSALPGLSKRRRVWHARRNNEMLAGIALKRLLGKDLKLVFTSAAQRDHKGFTKWMIRQMDAVVATSARSASFLEVPSRVIHHGIDADLFRPAEDKAPLRAELNLPQDKILVGCFGRIRPQKGNDLFTEAMLRLMPTRPDVVAVMMGGVTEAHKAYHEGLKSTVEKAGLSDRFLFLPEDPHWDISRWFRALDLYIAPQRWEGFGLTPMEAMACAVPVVATRAGAFEDFIPDGKAGHIVDIEDLDALTEATADLLDNPEKRASFAMAARAHVEAHCRIEQEAAALVALYRDLLAAP